MASLDGDSKERAVPLAWPSSVGPCGDAGDLRAQSETLWLRIRLTCLNTPGADASTIAAAPPGCFGKGFCPRLFSRG